MVEQNDQNNQLPKEIYHVFREFETYRSQNSKTHQKSTSAMDYQPS